MVHNSAQELHMLLLSYLFSFILGTEQCFIRFPQLVFNCRSFCPFRCPPQPLKQVFSDWGSMWSGKKASTAWFHPADLCDFEDGSCNWQQDTTDDFDWVRQSGHTPNPNTGPESDHTTNTAAGHYFYLPSSAGDQAGQKALMFSPLYPAGGRVWPTGRLTFWV